jgi:2-polyprenyl-3-methyl-5-hydroxy-6-metoxy-1,4-benzoquinol methylase
MTIPEFMATLTADTYPEERTQLHDNVTVMAMDWVAPHVKGKRVLDIGCGQGVALEEFDKRGFNAVGTGINEVDMNVCREKDLAVVRADMHEDWTEKQFDLIWARHVLEHSPIPLYVLNLLRERLAPEGVLYIEVPAPGTDARHETNQNHYSVLTGQAWTSLINKAGMKWFESRTLELSLSSGGKDEYLCFICKAA